MLHWLNMGGYWPYVWPAYLLTLLAMALNIYLARRDFRNAMDAVRRRLRSPGKES